jgi:N-acetylmuramoyl-L-alanine amidase
MNRTCAILFPLLVASLLPAQRLTQVSLFPFDDLSRISIQTGKTVSFTGHRVQDGPNRVYFDVEAPFGHPRPFTIEGRGPLIQRIRVAENQPGVTRVVLDLRAEVEWRSEQLTNPARLVIEVRPRSPQSRRLDLPQRAYNAIPPHLDSPPAPADPTQASNSRLSTRILNAKLVLPPPARSKVSPPNPPPQRPAALAAPARDLPSGQQTLTRVLGLKLRRVILDPGHGGHDHGTTGPGGLAEKELVLDVALRLGALLEQRLGTEVVFTRSDDTFLPLGARTRLANQRDGDLFLSIHANASRDPLARGVETYFLNLTPSRDAMEVAQRENATSEYTLAELNDIIRKIAMNDKLRESQEFARFVQSSLQVHAEKTSGRVFNRGVKKAPFVVLIGAQMPSILAEIGFLSNAKEESRMKQGDYRQKLAEALYSGIAKYVATLSRSQVAQARD